MKQPQRDDASAVDRKIDELLRSSPVKATYNFTAVTLARVRHADMEEDLERMVDDLIAHRPVEASADSPRVRSLASGERSSPRRCRWRFPCPSLGPTDTDGRSPG